MTDSSPLLRIEAAVARIDAAVAAQRQESDSLARRHAKLRDAMEKAVSALDEIIAQEDK
ncbi:hypothetical protein ACM61V_16910 [Sphingomonas sp. TX0543]|uniref:hypothetical protein n=1 Tax=unclassified Sphingomonas TaxID=196159 RepID=UPI00148599B7|nr:hypothetical protein [Sphingomonas sp. 3P27F8]